MKISINKITVPKNRRKLNPEKVGELKCSIKNVGLLQPIVVCNIVKGVKLVAGLHRLEACLQLGWQEIEAVIYETDDNLQCQLSEIDENLARNDLTILEKAEQTFHKENIYIEWGQRASPGRKKGDTMTPIKTNKDFAKEMGISTRTYQRYKNIAQDITPDVKDAIRDTEVANETRNLMRIANTEPENQMKEFQSILNKIENRKQEATSIKKLEQGNRPKLINAEIQKEEEPVQEIELKIFNLENSKSNKMVGDNKNTLPRKNMKITDVLEDALGSVPNKIFDSREEYSHFGNNIKISTDGNIMWQNENLGIFPFPNKHILNTLILELIDNYCINEKEVKDVS